MLNRKIDYSKDRFYKGPEGFYQLSYNCTPDEMAPPFGCLFKEKQKRPDTTPTIKSQQTSIKNRKKKIPTKSNLDDGNGESLLVENSYPHLHQEAVKRHADFNKATDQFIEAESDMANSLLEAFDTHFRGEQNTLSQMKKKTSGIYYEPAYYQTDCDEIPQHENFSNIAFDRPIHDYRITNDRVDISAKNRQKNKIVPVKSCSSTQDERRDQLLEKITRTLGYE